MMFRFTLRKTRRGVSGNKQRSNHKSRPLTLEGLEQRQLMSADVTLSGTLLDIRADPHGTDVVVSEFTRIAPPSMDTLQPIFGIPTSRAEHMLSVRTDGPAEAAVTRTFPYSDALTIKFQGSDSRDTFNNLTTIYAAIWGNGGSDVLRGGDGINYINGGSGVDVIFGGDGYTNILYGGTGDDWLLGGAGDDEMHGGPGNDHLFSYGGNDRLFGEQDNDTLRGGDDDDYLNGGTGDDWLFGESGRDELYAESGVDRLDGGAGDDTLVSIDNDSADSLWGGSGTDNFWLDANKPYPSASYTISDTVKDADTGEQEHNVHQVLQFANGADKSLDGDNLADPVDGHDYINVSSNDLFDRWRGIDEFDIKQGKVGNCGLMAALGAAAKADPNGIRRTVVDLDDGTYAVALGSKYYRVDGDVPTVGPYKSDLLYAGYGKNGSIWAPIIEKAYAFHQSSSNTYASLAGLWPDTVFAQLGSTDIDTKTVLDWPPFSGQRTPGPTELLNYLNGELDQGKAVVVNIRTPRGGALLHRDHSYVVEKVNYDWFHLFGESFKMPVSVVLYNPWRKDGAGNDGAGTDGQDDGLVTVTADQLVSSVFAHAVDSAVM